MLNRNEFAIALGATVVEGVNLVAQSLSTAREQYSQKLQIVSSANRCAAAIDQEVRPLIDSAVFLSSGQVQAGTPEQHKKIVSKRALEARKAVDDVFGIKMDRTDRNVPRIL